MPTLRLSPAFRARAYSPSERSLTLLRKLSTASLFAALMTGTASADTLREALVSTYQTSPTLHGERQALQATDANVAIARAAGRPQISATTGLNRDLTRSGILDNGQGK